MRGKLPTGCSRTPPSTSFNEARALCAGSWFKNEKNAVSPPTFNEARALCAGS